MNSASPAAPAGAGLTATPVPLPSSQPMPGTSTQVQLPRVPGSGAASTPGPPSAWPPPAGLPPQPTAQAHAATTDASTRIDVARIAPLYLPAFVAWRFPVAESDLLASLSRTR